MPPNKNVDSHDVFTLFHDEIGLGVYTKMTMECTYESNSQKKKKWRQKSCGEHTHTQASSFFTPEKQKKLHTANKYIF